MQEVSGVYTSPFSDTGDGFIGPKGFRDFQAPGPIHPFPRIAIYSCSFTSHQYSFIFLVGEAHGEKSYKKTKQLTFLYVLKGPRVQRNRSSL